MDRQFNNSLLNEDQDETTAPTEETEVQVPQRVRIRIGDSYHEVDESLANTIESERTKRDDAYFRKISEQGKQISDLREEMNRKRQEPVVSTPEEDEEADVEFYKAPTKNVARTIEEKLAQARKEIKQEVTDELTSGYNQQKQQEKYAAAFYAKHKHLVGREDLVYTVYAANQKKLEGLNWDQQHDLISDLVDEQAKKWTGTGVPREAALPEKEGKKISTKQVVTERSGNSKPAPKVQEVTEDDTDDLSDFLKKERERTRRARMA